MGSVTNAFAIGFRRTNTITGGTYFRAYNFKLLKGDYTNTELPTSINGIESVAERESKNLLDGIKWHDGWINVFSNSRSRDIIFKLINNIINQSF